MVGYNEQLDKELPAYAITCLDNLYSPLDTIDISLHHFRNDRGAINFAAALAKRNNWHSWEITQNGRKVYFINKNTKQEWPRKS